MIFCALPAMIKNYDFQCYYVSALVLRSKLNPYTIDYRPFISALGLHLPPDYKADFTPTLMLCFEPLTRVSMTEAFWIWIALNGIVLAFALYLLAGSRFSGLGSTSVWILVPFAILYAPVGIHFLYAQTVILVLALLACAMRAMQRGHEATAGILLAAAGLLRAFPLLLLVYLVIARRWQVLRWTIVGLMIGGAVTVALVGTASFDFFKTIGWATRPVTFEIPTNLALGAVVSRIYWYTCGSSTSGLIDLLRRLTTLCVEVVLVAVTVRVTRTLSGDDPDWRSFSLWIVLAMMLSPVVWPFYFVLLLIPYVQIIVGAYAGRASRRALLMALASYGLIGIIRSACSTLHFLMPFHALLDQGVMLSLIMAYVAMYWFVVDYQPAISEDRQSETSLYSSAAAAAS
jgi:Glycosyltransferase family 87